MWNAVDCAGVRQSQSAPASISTCRGEMRTDGKQNIRNCFYYRACFFHLRCASVTRGFGTFKASTFPLSTARCSGAHLSSESNWSIKCTIRVYVDQAECHMNCTHPNSSAASTSAPSSNNSRILCTSPRNAASGKSPFIAHENSNSEGLL